MDLLVIFLTGLTTGGLSCLAMQGGLLASTIANQKQAELPAGRRQPTPAQRGFDRLDWLPVTMFLGSKLIAHTLLGFLLGTLGGVVTMSLGMRLTFQVLAALFMFGTAMNLLQVHPIFRYLAFQPPKWIQRKIRGTQKSQLLFAPAILGAMTIFIPCGVTQAMEVLAINSGQPLYGASIMFMFTLGTIPLFAFLGIATSRLSEQWHKAFTRVAAYALIFMAVLSFNGVLLVLNSPITIQKLTRPVTWFFSSERFADPAVNQIQVVNGVQPVTIGVFNNGYSPNYIQFKVSR